MTHEEFVEIQTRLKCSNKQMATMLRKTEQSISNYRTGRQKIPPHVWKMLESELANAEEE